jgi:predicted nucleic-acid-binding Zn-ribbon protein
MPTCANEGVLAHYRAAWARGQQRRSATMPLDAAPRQKVITWLNRKCSGLKCSACGAEKWTVGDLVAMTDLSAKGMPSSAGFQAVPVICNSCGYTVFFSMAIIEAD